MAAGLTGPDRPVYLFLRCTGKESPRQVVLAGGMEEQSRIPPILRDRFFYRLGGPSMIAL